MGNTLLLFFTIVKHMHLAHIYSTNYVLKYKRFYLSMYLYV